MLRLAPYRGELSLFTTLHNIPLQLRFPTTWRFLRAGSHHTTFLWRRIKLRTLEEAQAASTCSYSAQTQRTPELRVSATLDESPEVELALA